MVGTFRAAVASLVLTVCAGLTVPASIAPPPHENSFVCTSAADCELLGECDHGTCRCHPGFAGPSCAQLDLAPPVGNATPAWPVARGMGANGQAYGWGFSVATDPHDQQLLHAVGNVGCYDPHGGMVTGTFLLHSTSSSGPLGPWVPKGIVTPPTTFNPHLRVSPSGEFILFFRGTVAQSPLNWTDKACAGMSATQWQELVHAGPYISASELSDPLGNFVATTRSMAPGVWTTKPFRIVGQDATCGNTSVIEHNSNPSAVILPSGKVVLAYRYTFRSGSESVNIAVADNVTGPYQAVFPCNYTMTSNTWGEDPFIWQSKIDGSLHVLYHCMRYGHGVPNTPGLHAWSRNTNDDGRDVWHTTTSPGHRGAYGTNISLADGTSTGVRFHRRERPDLLFDNTGRPVAFFSALQETTPPTGGGWGWSFSFGQLLRTSSPKSLQT
mmetsp:Transcript_11848/g.35720  ORF Transcript_11848/g.35720 Transcript_11848/m.35720 type:complete len:440 (+) Transcript_11848:198-1517(+)